MEAFFLEAAFRDEVDSYPSGVFDLGGGSVEIVEFLSPGFTKKGSIPMGAVRLHCALGEVRDRRCYLDEGRRRVSAVLREHLAACPASTLRGEVFGTGGTVQAIAQVLGKESFGRDELSRLLEHAALAEFRTGVPPHRQTVLLPGMLIVEGLLESLPVDLITYKRSPAKRGFLGLATLGPPVHSRG
jgi:exopolyphosphatase/pppGpp-phosphohydrolase